MLNRFRPIPFSIFLDLTLRSDDIQDYFIFLYLILSTAYRASLLTPRLAQLSRIHCNLSIHRDLRLAPLPFCPPWACRQSGLFYGPPADRLGFFPRSAHAPSRPARPACGTWPCRWRWWYRLYRHIACFPALKFRPLCLRFLFPLVFKPLKLARDLFVLFFPCPA